MPFLLALDEGTTSARAIIFDDEGVARSVAQKEFRQIFPQAGWVEHDAKEIWSTQLGVAIEAVTRANLRTDDIAAIGITNQRETTVVWDRETSEPVCNAIVWQDRRTAEMCDRLKAAGHEAMIRQRTGLVIDAYFSATKIAWILDNVPQARKRADAGKLAFGTIDSWLIWKLTSGRQHVTDATNASRTLLFNLHTGDWDDELLRLFNVPRSMLPEICDSSGVVAEVADGVGLDGLKIAGIAGDQQAALFGQLCLTPGQTKNTYGTGCFMLQAIGSKPIESRHRLLTTVARRIGNRSEYALEGSVFIGGAVVQWLRDGLGLFNSSSEIEGLARTVPDNGGVYFVPAFAGLGAPHWDAYARGAIVGITRGTTKGHIARAAIESVAFQVADLLDAVVADSGAAVDELRVDGGAAKNDLLMQVQADLLAVPVARPATTETTALGAAYLAGLAAGVWKDAQQIAAGREIERRFEPAMPKSQVSELRGTWRRAVERAKEWERPTSATRAS
jgi:glycerol kinase